MSSSYIDQIDREISRLNEEISRLNSAKEVILHLDRRAAKATLTLKAEPTAKKSEPITIRKLEAPKVPHRKAPPELMGKTIQKRIAAVISGHGPLPSGRIAEHMGLTEKDDKQRMYAALWSMGDKGLILKDDDGVFRLPAAEPQPEPDDANGEP